MQKKDLKFLLVIAALMLAAFACSFQASTANFAEVYMARDSEGASRTTTFSQADVFYAIVHLANAPDGTEVKAVWYAANVEGEDPETFIDEVSITSGDAILTFDMANTPDILWPRGSYRVDLYLNGELETSVNFQVQ